MWDGDCVVPGPTQEEVQGIVVGCLALDPGGGTWLEAGGGCSLVSGVTESSRAPRGPRLEPGYKTNTKGPWGLGTGSVCLSSAGESR